MKLFKKDDETGYVIIAFNQESWSKEYDILKEYNLHLKNKSLIGSYNGQIERSWLIPLSNNFNLESAIALASKYKQESILLLSGQVKGVRTAFILNMKKEVMKEGELIRIPEQPMDGSPFTIDSTTGKIYQIKE